MKTITFYSFKGGVGRSLMLSNMALWLADEMKAKVCVIDFDLEAPGLHHKFEDLQNPTDQARLASTDGIVEYIDEFKQTGRPPADFERFYLPFKTKKGNPLSLIPAGNLQKADYWRKLFDINWQQLFEYDPATGYSNGFLLLEDLKGRIENELAPDFLLIDSRTGLTEIASITLKLLADKVILMGINNPENKDGLYWVLRNLHADPNSRELPYHLVLNQVPMQQGFGRNTKDPREKKISAEFLERFKDFAPPDDLAKRFSIVHADDELAFGEILQEGFYVESQPKVQTRKDYWDVFTQVTKDYFTADQWALFENKRRAYELYYQAEFDTDNISEKIKLINEAIGHCDDDAFLYNYRFVQLYESDQKEAALNDIRKAIKLEPDEAVLHFNLGITYHFQQDYSLATAAYQKAIEIDPNLHEAWNNLGNTYYPQQEYALAIAAYQKAIDISSEYNEAWNNLGNIYYSQLNYSSAISAYQKAIEIEPGYQEAWYNLGNAYDSQQKYDLSIAAYQKAIEIKPNDHAACFNLGATYFNQKEYNLAIAAHQKAIEIKPDYHEAWFNLGNTYDSQKEYALAMDAYHKAIVIKPDYCDALYNLACTYALLNRKEEALHWLKEALEKGWSSLQYVQEDNDWVSLRDDADFKALLAQFAS